MNIDCKDLFARLSEYLDVELDPADCAAFEKHIAACAPCVEFVESLRATAKLCGDYRSDINPEPLQESVKARLREAWTKTLKHD